MVKYFVREVTFPYFAKREGLPGIRKEMDDLEKSQFWPAERILDLQKERLRKLLVHAYENTAYYRKTFDLCGYNPYGFRHCDELRRIPVLTKDIIRENLPDLVASNLLKKEIHVAETGGTSGVKMRFYRDNKCLTVKEAGIYRFGRWAGWDFGENMGMVWPAHQDFTGYRTFKSKIKNAFYKRLVFYPAAIMDDPSSERYLRLLANKRPTMILAFSSPIYELARYMKRAGVDHVSVQGIVTTGEPLYQAQRELIEEAFHCRVFDSYRSREAGPLAQECHAHKGMHISAECLHLEAEPQGGLSGGGEKAGPVLVTDLMNYGMPLIRYDTGDLGTLSYRRCPCGRGLPMLESIVGRATDTFISPAGSCIPTIALVMYLVNTAPDLIGQMQVVQDARDHLLFRYTSDPAPSEKVLEHQRNIIEKLFGKEMRISYEYVDEIPREKSGKYQYAKRLIARPDERGGEM
jgi:phenylacetate-CoA ligase